MKPAVTIKDYISSFFTTGGSSIKSLEICIEALEKHLTEQRDFCYTLAQELKVAAKDLKAISTTLVSSLKEKQKLETQLVIQKLVHEAELKDLNKKLQEALARSSAHTAIAKIEET